MTKLTLKIENLIEWFIVSNQIRYVLNKIIEKDKFSKKTIETSQLIIEFTKINAFI